VYNELKFILFKGAIEMVKLLIGHKGSGKTKNMIQLANDRVETADGSVVFINKNQRLMYDLKHAIRVVCMEEYEQIKNSDEYIGFLYGILSSDHDIEVIFIDSILKHADVDVADLPGFLSRLKEIADKYNIEFVVSLSASTEEIGDIASQYEILN
jgi:predicted ATP-dependent serine protease